MNKYIIIGALVRDPETGTTDSGVNWCRFTVAARKRYHREGEPDAEFVRVTAWRALGDTCARFLRKGRKVAVTGEPKAHGWNGQDGSVKAQIEMTADDVEFVSSGSGNSSPTDDDAPPAPAENVDRQSGMTVVDPEEQPF